MLEGFGQGSTFTKLLNHSNILSLIIIIHFSKCNYYIIIKLEFLQR